MTATRTPFVRPGESEDEAILLAVHPDEALSLFADVADAAAAVLHQTTNWGPSGRRDGQYAVDLTVDAVVLELLGAAGVSVLSEESGVTAGDPGAGLVIVDPLDGSTNASQGIPWFATSLCWVDENGPAAALVRNQASGVTFTAVRGGGAHRDGVAIAPSRCTDVDQAILGLSGMPPDRFGWRQFRALGASALDLCLVASGALDGFVDCSPDAHGVWDYAGAMLICSEAGAVVADALGRDLLVHDPSVKRTPVAAATPALLDRLTTLRRWF